jgi:hypothetical protein
LGIPVIAAGDVINFSCKFDGFTRLEYVGSNPKAKQRACEVKRGRTGEVEVRLVGWGSSLLDEATTPSPRQVADEIELWPLAWEAHMQETHQDDHEKQQLHDRIAQLMARNDRRHYPRLAQSAEISIRQLSAHMEKVANVVLADVQNLSRGGICIGSRVPLTTSSVVQCQIGVPDLRFAVPSLMQVVWLERTGASEFSVGLRYLL